MHIRGIYQLHMLGAVFHFEMCALHAPQSTCECIVWNSGGTQKLVLN